MPAPVIPTLPTAPSRNDSPDTFVSRADAHVAALTPWTTTANSFGTYMDALATAADTDATTATTQAGVATTQATLASEWATKTSGPVSGSEYSAKKHAIDAAASAVSATNSPGTQATSTSSILIGTGSKSLTLTQTGKNFVVGQWVAISRTSAPTVSYMMGAITAFNSGTGAMTVDVSTINGTGTFTDWTIAQGSPIYKYGLTTMGGINLDIEKGTTISPTNEDISTYLRSGTTATVATYPLAVGKGIDCYGTATGGVSTSFAGDIAHDGANTLVATTGASNSVSVSTDGGATWTATAVSLAGVNIVSVCRLGSRFIVAGNAGITLKLAYSTNGTSWTAGATQALTGNANDSASIVSDGTIALIVVVDGGTSAFTTTDGTSITVRTIPAILVGNGTRAAVIPSLGANRWLIAGPGGTTAYRSTAADASTWSAAQTLPTQPYASLISTSDKFILVKSGVLYYSSTGLTGSWTTVTLPPIATKAYGGSLDTSAGGKCQAHFDGTRLWVGATIGTTTTSIASHAVYTTDLSTFATWTPVQAYQTFNGLVTKGAGIAPVVCGTNLVFMKIEGGNTGSSNYGNASTSTPTYIQQTNWASGPARVGLTMPVTLDANAGTYFTDKLVGYVRVA